MNSARRSKPAKRVSRVAKGAVAADELQASFPSLSLPVRPPFPPMEARSVPEIPSGAGWQFEPKWDGFRALAFRKGDQALLQSKSGQPLGRYFPELLKALRRLPQRTFVLDGEIVILRDGSLSFDDLLLRIHPAESRVRKLAAETPCTYLIFDFLVDGHGRRLTTLPLSERRKRLRGFLGGLSRGARVRLSPATTDRRAAERWMRELGAAGFDGVVAKRSDDPYLSGERAFEKIKRQRTADCVVGGYRYSEKGHHIGSLLLGLYDENGRLDHVGFTSSFSRADRRALKPVIEPLTGGSGFTGRAPGGPSRWSKRRSDEWQPLDPKLVCEVQYDHFSGGRFRHGTKFLRWRPDKAPRQCTFEQVLGSRTRSSLPEWLADIA